MCFLDTFSVHLEPRGVRACQHEVTTTQDHGRCQWTDFNIDERNQSAVMKCIVMSRQAQLGIRCVDTTVRVCTLPRTKLPLQLVRPFKMPSHHFQSCTSDELLSDAPCSLRLSLDFLGLASCPRRERSFCFSLYNNSMIHDVSIANYVHVAVLGFQMPRIFPSN